MSKNKLKAKRFIRLRPGPILPFQSSSSNPLPEVTARLIKPDPIRERGRIVKVFWLSRHKLSKQQRSALSQIYPKFHIIQHPGTVSSYQEILAFSQKCDVLAVNIGLELKRDLLKHITKPIIQSTLYKFATMAGNTYEIIYDGWEQVLRAEYDVTKVLHLPSQHQIPRILYLDRRPLPAEHIGTLSDIFATEIELTQRPNLSKKWQKILNLARSFDAIILASHNTCLTQYLLANLTQPVLHPCFIRQETGKYAYNQITGFLEREIVNIPNGFYLVNHLDFVTKRL